MPEQPSPHKEKYPDPKEAKRILDELLRHARPELDELVKKEEEDYQRQMREAMLQQFNQNMKERKKYARWLFMLSIAWLVVVLVMVLLSGMGYLDLATGVLIALLGTATLAVLGLFNYVVKYLFPSEKGEE